MSGRSLDRVKTAKAEIEASTAIKGSLSALQLDITDEDSIANAVEQVEQDYGHLNAVVNNAAVGNQDPDLKIRLTASLTTNVIGPALVAQAFRPLLLKSPKPYSIFVSSGVGSMTNLTANANFSKLPENVASLPREEAYRSSKAALNMIAIIEARDFGPKGLMVYSMCPGFVVSNLRGEDEESRSGWGDAGDPAESGRLVLSILEGERDGDMGKFVNKNGTYPW